MMRRLVISYILRSSSSFHLSTPPPPLERSTLLSHLLTFPPKPIPISTQSSSSTTLLSSPRSNLHEARTQGSNHAVGVLHEAITSNPNPYDDLETALSQTGVVLTTPIVSKILQRLQFEEKTAFRFFTWAGHQAHYYSHEPSTYNEMIDILSSTKYKNKQFRIVIDMLDYMKRNNKESVPADVMLEILRKYCERYLTHVQKFAKRKRIRVKTQPEINAFNFLLDALCKCGLVKEAEALVRKMRFKVKPDASTYNVLFFGCCRVRDPKKAMKLMEEMIELDTSLRTSLTVLRLMLLLCCFRPTARTFALMIVALAKSGKEDECFELIGRMIAMGCLPDVSTYKDVVEGMCNAGKVEEAYRFLDEMGSKGYPPDIVTYNCFLRVLCESKKSGEAVKLYKRMVETSCVPSVQTYNMLITITWREMEERGCGQDVETYCAMVNGLFDCGREKEACFLLEEVRLTLLMRLSEVGNIKVIHKVSEHMKKFYNHSMARRFALSEKRKSTKLRGK
ncbi:hypothetical protein Bca52824_084232 [Brassica carinata]|uniref:Pentatricopeptide repeat-containing protein n=1 Tax=Brassica carinata TaxID=52824 RepID=A0A8X7PLQ4_BRACI|nr:hypothetical protein Bca52824_084232 [Brassica carinata]